MIVVASEWEQGWNTPIKELDLWHFPLRDFGVNKLAMFPVSGVFTNKVKEFHNADDIIQHYGLPLIICDENGETDLKDFKHPEDALYLFSRTSKSLLTQYESVHSIKISTKENKGLLWGHQAACIILYDRFLKNGNNNSR